MADKILIKRSDTPSAEPSPSDLSLGELAMNTADGLLFMKTSDGNIVKINAAGGGPQMVAVRKSQLFTTSGTWVRPANMIGSQVEITGIGGGASGNSNNVATGQGGDGGQWVIDAVVDIGEAASVDVTVGDGGARPTSGAVGNAGEPTSFGPFFALLGGAAVTGGTRPTPLGASGRNSSGTSGQWVYGGDTPLGYGGSSYNTSNVGVGGAGLVLDDSGITAETVGLPANTTPAVGYGAGGSTGSTGRAGAQGALKVSWWERVEVES